MGFCVGDELRNALHRKRRIHLHELGHADNAGDRRRVANEIEVQVLKQGRIDCGTAAGNEESVTVCGTPNDRLGADIAARAWTVLDEELLTEVLREPLGNQTPGDVICAASRNGNDNTHRPRRIGLRPGFLLQRRERAGAYCQLQEFATVNFHASLQGCLEGGVTASALRGLTMSAFTYRDAVDSPRSLRFELSSHNHRPAFFNSG